jgi:CBS-domain-containing membrane protein
MKVEDLMCKDVQTVSMNKSLADAARLMWDADCGCVPVLDDAGHLTGMITDRDICMAATMRGQPPSEIAIHDIASRQPHSCLPSQDVRDAARVMQRAQLRRLPVADAEGRIVGILSLTDIVRAAEHPQRGREAPMSLDEVAHTLDGICRPHAANGKAQTTAS